MRDVMINLSPQCDSDAEFKKLHEVRRNAIKSLKEAFNCYSLNDAKGVPLKFLDDLLKRYETLLNCKVLTHRDRARILSLMDSFKMEEINVSFDDVVQLFYPRDFCVPGDSVPIKTLEQQGKKGSIEDINSLDNTLSQKQYSTIEQRKVSDTNNHLIDELSNTLRNIAKNYAYLGAGMKLILEEAEKAARTKSAKQDSNVERCTKIKLHERIGWLNNVVDDIGSSLEIFSHKLAGTDLSPEGNSKVPVVDGTTELSPWKIKDIVKYSIRAKSIESKTVIPFRIMASFLLVLAVLIEYRFTFCSTIAKFFHTKMSNLIINEPEIYYAKPI